MIDLSPYKKYKTFWGLEYPIVELYDENNVLTDSWTFQDLDGFTIGFKVERDQARNVMEDGSIRDRRFGFWLITRLAVTNIDNRELMVFFAKIHEAARIRISPHPGVMRNPDTVDYYFDMIPDNDFEPEYFPEGRWGGHSIEVILRSQKRLNKMPQDYAEFIPIPRITETIAGAPVVNEQTSVTYFNEKLFMGDWELTEDDLAYVAFFEAADAGGEDPYGEIW